MSNRTERLKSLAVVTLAVGMMLLMIWKDTACR